MPANLLVAEIFSSIQGESHWAGYPCTFVRLAGCNLECSYCDTRYAREGGTPMTVADVAEAVAREGLATVEVTGGEPLLQPAALLLLGELARSRRVLLETNGSLPLDGVPAQVCVVMDLKAPGSGMAAFNRWENLAALKPGDEVKVVCSGRADYEWARAALAEHDLPRRARVSLSPAWGVLEPAEMARWILADRLDVRLQVQLHRILWPGTERGV